MKDAIRLPISFIHDGSMDVYTKMIVITELYYNQYEAGMGNDNKFPTQLEVAKNLRLTRQTVANRQKDPSYALRSPRHTNFLQKKEKNIKTVDVPCELIKCPININERMILICILSYLKEDFPVIPISQITRDLSISKRTVITHTNALEKLNLLMKKCINDNGGTYNVYSVPDDLDEQLTYAKVKMQLMSRNKC